MKTIERLPGCPLRPNLSNRILIRFNLSQESTSKSVKSPRGEIYTVEDNGVFAHFALDRIVDVEINPPQCVAKNAMIKEAYYSHVACKGCYHKVSARPER